MNILEAKWRKSTDINREYATFELVLDGVIILDVSFSDDGFFEVAFHEGVSNTIIRWDEFVSVIDRGRKTAEADK